MAGLTPPQPVRATAPFDDAAVGGEPLVVDPADPSVEVVEHRHHHATLIETAADPAAASTRTRVVLLRPDGDHGAGPPGTRRREILIDGWRVVVEVEPAARAELRERARRAAAAGSHGGPVEVRAIIPGRVLSIAVAAGDPVTAGQQLLVVEAMKMQNELRAPRDGVVERLAVSPGGTIELGDLLVVLS